MVNSWSKFWMRFAGLNHFGRISMGLAALPLPKYKSRIPLAFKNKAGFVEMSAVIRHSSLTMGECCFIGDRVVLYERDGGEIELGDRVEINRDTTLETGPGGKIHVGNGSSIHGSCHIYSYSEPIIIGSGVMIAANCAFYSYNHGIDRKETVRQQELISRGPIRIGDESWLGAMVTVLDGVSIGEGAVIAAGAVVTHDVPDFCIAAGVPAKVIKIRE